MTMNKKVSQIVESPEYKGSDLLEFFKEVPDCGLECVLCHDIVKIGRTSKSTRNLLNHMRSRHPEKTQHPPQPCAPSAASANNCKPSGKSSSAEKDLMPKETDAVTSTPIVDPETGNMNFTVQVSSGVNSGFQQKPLRSSVWKYFKKDGLCSGSEFTDYRHAQFQVSCLVCGATLTQSYGTTTSLRRHLKARHPGIATVPLSSQQKSTSLNGSCQKNGIVSVKCASESPPKMTMSKGKPIIPVKPRKISDGLKRKKLLDGKLLSMIVSDLQPTSIIERKGFIDLVSALDPHYIMPSKEDVDKKLLPTFYQEVVDRVVKQLAEIKHIALTTDLWSPRNEIVHLSVTAHFICPKQWTPQSLLLATTTFYGNPGGKDIAGELRRVASEWDMTERITVMIVDGETSTILDNEPLPWAYIPCLGHLIHLVVTEAVSADKETLELIEKVRGIVSFFQHNEEASQNLVNMGKSGEVSASELPALVINNSDRWNSTFYMLEKAFEQMEAINVVLNVYEMEEKILSSDEGELLKKIISSLKPFQIAISALSSKESCVSMALPIIKGLLKMVSSMTGAKEPLTENLKQSLAQSFGNIDEIECVIAATLLDPRLKFSFAVGQQVIERATQVVKSDLAKMAATSESINNDVSQSSSVSNPKVHDDFWELMDILTDDQPMEEVISTPMSREITRYLDSPPIGKDEDPLVYWRQHEELYPSLSKLALKYLSVPVTSIPSKLLFTNAGDDFVHRRSMLKADSVNVILFLNKNVPV